MVEKKKDLISLVVELSKYYDGFIREEMKKNGIKSSYRHLLRPLAIQDGVTQLDLVKISRLKAPTVSTTLRNMELEGLVQRETDKDDARATRVFITQKGKEIDAKMRESTKEIVKIFVDGLSEKEQKIAVDAMAKMFNNIRSSEINPSIED